MFSSPCWIQHIFNLVSLSYVNTEQWLEQGIFMLSWFSQSLVTVCFVLFPNVSLYITLMCSKTWLWVFLATCESQNKVRTCYLVGPSVTNEEFLMKQIWQIFLLGSVLNVKGGIPFKSEWGAWLQVVIYGQEFVKRVKYQETAFRSRLFLFTFWFLWQLWNLIIWL